MSNYRIVVDKGYLEHHGVIGQKWGKKNGPPYPLSSEISTGSRLKVKNKKSVLNKDISELATSYRLKKLKSDQKKAAQKLKIEKAKTKLMETQEKVSEEQKKNTPIDVKTLSSEQPKQEERKQTAAEKYGNMSAEEVKSLLKNNASNLSNDDINYLNNRLNALNLAYNASKDASIEERKLTPSEKFGTIDANSVKTILKNDAAKLTNDELNYLNNRLSSLNNAYNATRDSEPMERLMRGKQAADNVLNAVSTATRLYDLTEKVFNKLSGKPKYPTKSYEYLLKNFDKLSTSELEDAVKRLSKMEDIKKKAKNITF